MKVKVRKALVIAASAVALTCAPVTEAAATTAADNPEGTWAWSLPSCKHSKRLGHERSIYARSGKYYGWAEVRLGTAGRCRGYAWVRLHVRVPIHLLDGMGVGFERPDFAHSDGFTVGDLYYVETGTHDGLLTRSNGRRIKAWITEGVAKVYSGESGRYRLSRLVFGHMVGGKVEEYLVG